MSLLPPVLLVFLLFATGGPLGTAIAQEAGVIAGGDIEFQNYCAVCHGVDAQGTGPMAKYLKLEPANLTLLAKKNGGEFPFWQVYRVIDGREGREGHGTREMPIWGDRFLAEPQGRGRYSKTETAGRILGLVFFLRHLQER
jgi:mono/diheme cytochrome c family protein